MRLNDLDFSDIYLSDHGCNLRVKGCLQTAPSEVSAEVEKLKKEVFLLWRDNLRPEFTLEFEAQRYRVAVFESISGVNAVLRKTNPNIYRWSQLSFPHHYLEQLLHPAGNVKRVEKGGIILVTGKPDSGKTTTCHALINEIMEREPWFCMTLEDPVETLLPTSYPNGSIVEQRDILSRNLPQALMLALRTNCDVIFVGEIRDEAGGELALQAAHTGHLVITTLHAHNLIMGLERFLEVVGNSNKNRELFSNVFRGAIWQSLFKESGLMMRTLSSTALFSDSSVCSKIRQGKFSQLQSDLDKQQAQSINSVC